MSTAVPSPRRARLWPLLLVLLACAAVYWPGLGGGYVFDDFPNIVDNTDLHVLHGTAGEWRQAAWSSPASAIQRPLASLSFAANYFFSGPDPWPMKATNLALHLANGVLLFFLIARIAALAGTAGDPRPRRLAWFVTALWLLHPINVSPVLYVVQRMEILAQCFVLAGLHLYLQARTSARGSAWRLWLGVPACLLAGALCKESAVLLTLYALLLEGLLPGVSRTPAERRRLAFFYALFLAIPAALGLAWLLPGIVSGASFSGRGFDPAQRVLTEARVLLDYLRWTVLPLPGSFNLYHDDYAVSRGLLQPPTTLLALLLLAALAGIAARLRPTRPLFALGVAWFFAAHLLTATVVPLELVFEHRNYFASIGAILAAADLLLPGTSALAAPGWSWRTALLGGWLALATATTALRALDWSHPVTFAAGEAARHPQSPRAAYELARTLVIATGFRSDSPLLPRAFAALEHAATLPGSGANPLIAEIMLAGRTGQPVDPGTYRRLEERLTQQPAGVEDAGALLNLVECQRQGLCPNDDEAMLRLFLAATRRSSHPALLYAYAIFAYHRLHDPELALRLARDAAAPGNDVQYRLNLAAFLIDLGRPAEAKEALDAVAHADRWGRTSAKIAALRQRLP